MRQLHAAHSVVVRRCDESRISHCGDRVLHGHGRYNVAVTNEGLVFVALTMVRLKL